MKKIFLITVLVIAGIVLTLTHSSTSTSEGIPAMPAVSEQAQPADAPVVTAPPTPEPELVVNTTPPVPNPREQWLNTLYESPSVADRLQAARLLAVRGDEEAFLDLASFIVAAEATGEGALLDLAQQVATILGQMYGAEIQTIATELAYSPSELVAEAAVNAAVAAEPAQVPQWFESGTVQNPADQSALDDYLQKLQEYDLNSLQSPVSKWDAPSQPSAQIEAKRRK
jgi:hypothetical protein